MSAAGVILLCGYVALFSFISGYIYGHVTTIRDERKRRAAVSEETP